MLEQQILMKSATALNHEFILKRVHFTLTLNLVL